MCEINKASMPFQEMSEDTRAILKEIVNQVNEQTKQHIFQFDETWESQRLRHFELLHTQLSQILQCNPDDITIEQSKTDPCNYVIRINDPDGTIRRRYSTVIGLSSDNKF